MSEEITKQITELAEAQPKFMAMLCVGLLFRLAGQETFNILELARINMEYNGLRMNLSPDAEELTVTLNRADEVTAMVS